MKMIIKRLHFIFGLMIAILFISSSIKGQTYFSVLEPYKCKILSPRFFNTIDSIIDLEKLRKTREFYNVSLIIHPNKYDRFEWREISGEVNLRDIDVIVSVFKSDIPRGIYAVKYKNKKFIFRGCVITDVYQPTKIKDYIISQGFFADRDIDWYIRFRYGEYAGHMYKSTGEFPAHDDWYRYPWEFDESAPHDTINSIY